MTETKTQDLDPKMVEAVADILEKRMLGGIKQVKAEAGEPTVGQYFLLPASVRRQLREVAHTLGEKTGTRVYVSALIRRFIDEGLSKYKTE